MITPKLKTKEFSIEIHDKFIKLQDHRSDTTISKFEIQQMMAEVEKHRNAEKIFLLVVTGENTMLTNEAREYITHLAKSKTFKIGIIIHDLAQRIMGNFVIHLLNNRTILQLFTNEKDAKKWLLDN